jgi:magnesium transporter
MSADPLRAADVLNRRFFIDYPLDAAIKIEDLSPAEVFDAASRQPVHVLVPVWRRLLPETAARLLRGLPDDLAVPLLSEIPPPEAIRILGHMADGERSAVLGRLDPTVRQELETLMSYPPDTAGRIMDTSVAAFRRDMTAGAALSALRERGAKTTRGLFLVDDELRLLGDVALQDIALAAPDTTLGALAKPITARVGPLDPIQVVTDAFERQKVFDLPVVDLDGVFLGAVMHDDLAQTIHEEAVADIQTMVGASREERALSSPQFTVRKRMPWLQINLLTAFLAAAVVGLFESTIAQVTALAVLLPVVAGQSGNAGAQALAVTMRGLALREITVRQWARVMRKEVIAGFLNGVAIAITCGIGVFLWSGSSGLVLVIALSMVLAMVVAGFAGALIPILLTRVGQDPATSSSIILTTVTDVAGFFSFLGIATLLLNFV